MQCFSWETRRRAERERERVGREGGEEEEEEGERERGCYVTFFHNRSYFVFLVY